MKKTVMITINGIIFNIDEDAYEKLQSYIEALKHYFGSKPEANEIIEDIEARIAELFQPRVSESKQTINIQDVEEMIKILGNPEDIAGASDEDFEAGSEYKSSQKTNRRLYRDPDSRVLGGVCSGLGAYFAIDPVVFRLLFIVLLFVAFVSSVIYIILWIAVPIAKTAAQKLEMRGENVTISNIERTFRKEYQHVRDNLNRIDTQSFWHKIQLFLNEVLDLLGSLFRAIWAFCRVAFGLALIIFSLFFIIGLLGVFFMKNFDITGITEGHFASLKDFLVCIIDPINIDTLLILFFIVIAIPVAGLIYAGLKLVVRFKAKDRWVVLSLFIFWIIAVITLSVFIFDEVGNFRQENSTKEIVNLANPKNNILYVTSPGYNDEDYKFLRHSNFFNVNYKGKTKELYGITEIDIEKNNSANPEIEIVRSARGKNHDDALDAAKQIKINYQQNDSVLNISPVFYLSQDQRWKFQGVKVILRLPVGMKVYLNENTEYLLDDIENTDDYWDNDMAGKTWRMTDDGLSKVRKEK